MCWPCIYFLSIILTDKYACYWSRRRLRHGNLVQLRAASYTDKLSLYIIMEKCPLGSLFSRIKEVRAQSHSLMLSPMPVQDD